MNRWPTAIQYLDTARDGDDATTMLHGLAHQDGFRYGRVLTPSPSKPGRRVQAFFVDEPANWDAWFWAAWLPDGCRRVILPPAFATVLTTCPCAACAEER